MATCSDMDASCLGLWVLGVFFLAVAVVVIIVIVIVVVAVVIELLTILSFQPYSCEKHTNIAQLLRHCYSFGVFGQPY